MNEGASAMGWGDEGAGMSSTGFGFPFTTATRVAMSVTSRLSVLPGRRHARHSPRRSTPPTAPVTMNDKRQFTSQCPTWREDKPLLPEALPYDMSAHAQRMCPSHQQLTSYAGCASCYHGVTCFYHLSWSSTVRTLSAMLDTYGHVATSSARGCTSASRRSSESSTTSARVKRRRCARRAAQAVY